MLAKKTRPCSATMTLNVMERNQLTGCFMAVLSLCYVVTIYFSCFSNDYICLTLMTQLFEGLFKAIERSLARVLPSKKKASVFLCNSMLTKIVNFEMKNSTHF